MSAVAKLQAVLGMDAKEFKAGIKSSTRDAQSFQGQIKKIGTMMAGAFSVGAIIAAGKSLVTWASNISEAAQNAGVLTSEMMALNEVALKGGLGVDEMRRMLSKLQTELGDAAAGTETSRKKFESLGLNITELAGLDPAALFQKVAKAAMDSGTPLQHLADIFGDKLGPKAMAAMRDLAENGLPAIGSAAADAADKVEELGDRWASMLEKIKIKTLEVTMATVDGAAVAASFLKGATSGMSTTEKVIRGGLAVPTLGMSLIGSNFNADKGIASAMDTQGGQWAESQKRKEDKQKQMEDARNANKKSAQQTEQDIAQKKFLEQFVEESKGVKGTSKDDFKKEIEGNYADYFSRIAKTNDMERAAGERNARLQEQLTSMTATSPAQMNPDAMARIGGFMGGERAGLDVASKSLHVQEETLRVQQEMKQNMLDLVEAVNRQNGGK